MTDTAPTPDPNVSDVPPKPDVGEIPPEVPVDNAGENALAQAEIDAVTAAPSESPIEAEADALAAEMASAIASEAKVDALPPAALSEIPAPAPANNAIAQSEIDALAAEMEAAMMGDAPGASPVTGAAAAPAVAPSTPMAEAGAPFEAPELSESAEAGETSLDMLDDVQLDVKIELGRTHMYIEDVLKLGAGSVVELDKLAGDPVDIYVNERLIARGEVLVLNDNFCVRINAIHNPVSELEVG